MRLRPLPSHRGFELPFRRSGPGKEWYSPASPSFQLTDPKNLQPVLYFLMDLFVFRKPVHVQLGKHLLPIKEHFEPPVAKRFKLKG